MEPRSETEWRQPVTVIGARYFCVHLEGGGRWVAHPDGQGLQRRWPGGVSAPVWIAVHDGQVVPVVTIEATDPVASEPAC